MRYHHDSLDPNKKARLSEAFGLLQQAGMIARQNFSCCSSCAGYEITQLAEKRTEKGAVIMGCVFYHQQDAANLRESGKCYLSFGDMSSTKFGVIGLPTMVVGRAVCEALDTVGLKYEWDGSQNTRILVDCSYDRAEPVKVVVPEPVKILVAPQEPTLEPIQKPVLKLVGSDGNAYAILGAAQSAARRAGWNAEHISTFMKKAMSGSYDNLLATCMDEFDVR